MKVQVDTVEQALARLWSEEARRSGAAHAALLTVVALVGDPALLPRVDAVLSRIACAHPSRAIVATWREGAGPRLEAEVQLQRDADKSNQTCGECIHLDASGTGRGWLPENVDRLLLPDLPVCVWWVGDLPDADDLYDRMVRLANVVMLNSSEMDLRDLEKIARLLRAAKGRYALADLTWVRLRPVQDMVARFFDDPATRPLVDGVDRISIAFSPRVGDPDAASAEAAMLLGWMATTLGWKTAGTRWSRRGTLTEVALAKRGGSVTATFEQDRRDGVPDGAITKVELVCGPARFSVARLAEDPQIFLWAGDVPGVPIPTQRLPVRPHDEAYYFQRYLQRPARDSLLEATIATTSEIVRPVAPRLSARPPNDGP